MDLVQFGKKIPPEQLVEIFKSFFNEHMVAYDLVRGVELSSVNVITEEKSSIKYSIKLLNEADRDKLSQSLTDISIDVYGKQYSPQIFINGDLLCITIVK